MEDEARAMLDGEKARATRLRTSARILHQDSARSSPFPCNFDNLLPFTLNLLSPGLSEMDSPVLNHLFRQLFRHPACQSLRPSLPSHTFRLSRSHPQYRTFITRRAPVKRKSSDDGLNWTKRGDYPKNIDEELKTYPLVTAKELRHRRDRPRQVQMLTREFIDGKSSIDCAHYTYFLTIFLVFGIRQFVQSPLWLLLQARDHL